MKNKIDSVFMGKMNPRLMTHVIAGYPDIETTNNIIIAMDKSGADLIEIQIPFSDPMADGATIMKANQIALNNVNTDTIFDMIRNMENIISAPLLIMTYANIPFSYGIAKFIEKCASVNIQGIIIPDFPFDEENDDYISIAKKYNIHPIQVTSPGIEEDRLNNLLEISSGFIYTTLKTGITGAQEEINRGGFDFLKYLKSKTLLPIAAGFGISRPEHVHLLKDKCDAAIIGSRLIEIYDKEGIEGIERFIRKCKSV